MTNIFFVMFPCAATRWPPFAQCARGAKAAPVRARRTPQEIAALRNRRSGGSPGDSAGGPGGAMRRTRASAASDADSFLINTGTRVPERSVTPLRRITPRLRPHRRIETARQPPDDLDGVAGKDVGSPTRARGGCRCAAA